MTLNDTALDLVTGGITIDLSGMRAAEKKANQVDAANVFAQNSYDHYTSSRTGIANLLRAWSSMHRF